MLKAGRNGGGGRYVGRRIWVDLGSYYVMFKGIACFFYSEKLRDT